ncbi:MAG: hypothetical protein WB816_14410 [Methylocystis sp.]
MSAFLYRALLLLTVLASVFVRINGLRNNQEMRVAFDMNAAIKQSIADSGLSMLKNDAPPSTALAEAVYFQRPNCERTSWVMPYALSSEGLLYMRQVVEPGFDQRYIYLDKEWPAPDRFAMYVEWVKNMVFGGVGQSRYFTDKSALFVAEPKDCDRSAIIDWRRVWLRNKRSGEARADIASKPVLAAVETR